MEQMQYKIKTIALLIFCFQLGKTMAFEEKKKVTCGYDIDKTASIELTNQYGDIEIVQWEKDSIRLEATIVVNSDDQEDLSELMDMVEVDCAGNRTNVVIETKWTDASSMWKRGSIDLKKRYGSDNKLVINYKVYMPVTCRLSINNRFGDVYLPSYKGPLRVVLAHGDLRARTIEDARRIEVKYGKILIKHLVQGLVKLSYGNLIVDQAERVTLESKSSDIEMFKVEKLSLESRNDDIRLEDIANLRGELTYTQLRVKMISRLVDLNTSYGDVTLKQIQSGFYSIRIDGSNTDYDLEFLEGSAFQFSVESSGGKSVSFMKDAQFTTEEQEGNTNYIKGYLKQKDASPIVNIVSKNGYISFY